MKTNKYLEEIREKSAADLNEELVSLKKELFNLRFQSAVGKLENTDRISKAKKAIARMKTVLTQRANASK